MQLSRVILFTWFLGIQIFIFPFHFHSLNPFLVRALTCVYEPKYMCTPEGIHHLSHYRFLNVYSHCLPLWCKHHTVHVKALLGLFSCFYLKYILSRLFSPRNWQLPYIITSTSSATRVAMFEVIISLPSCLYNHLTAEAVLHLL